MSPRTRTASTASSHSGYLLALYVLPLLRLCVPCLIPTFPLSLASWTFHCVCSLCLLLCRDFTYSLDFLIWFGEGLLRLPHSATASGFKSLIFFYWCLSLLIFSVIFEFRIWRPELQHSNSDGHCNAFLVDLLLALSLNSAYGQKSRDSETDTHTLVTDRVCLLRVVRLLSPCASHLLLDDFCLQTCAGFNTESDNFDPNLAWLRLAACHISSLGAW